LGWPWRRFEAFYEAHQKRQIIDELTTRKIAMINALYSNSNYDGQENNEKRDRIIQTLEDQFNESVAILYGVKQTAKDKDEIDENNPFFQAMKRGLERQGVLDVEGQESTDSGGGDRALEEDIPEIDQNG
jgi:hypothetical protein